MPAKKQITKEQILAAALALLREGGMERVTVSTLAERLHCSTQPIYLSFSGIGALREALIPMVVQYFADEMRKDNNGSAAPLFSMAYIHFAQRESALFRFLFMRSGAYAEIRPVLMPMIEQGIGALMAEYRITHAEADWLHDQLWMHAHGIAAMVATGFCQWDMDKVAAMLADSKACLGRKFEAQP